MKKILFILSSIIFTTTVSTSVIACGGGTVNPNPPAPEEKTYDITFKQITTAFGKYFKHNDDGQPYFLVEKKNIVDATNLSWFFWSSEGYVDTVHFYEFDQSIWDKIASAYGFNSDTSSSDIEATMKTKSISNVSMKVTTPPSPPYGYGRGYWLIKEFSIS